MVHMISDFVDAAGKADEEVAPSVVRLADDQFARLVKLLTPGYELAKLHLETVQAPPRVIVPAESAAPSAVDLNGTD